MTPFYNFLCESYSWPVNEAVVTKMEEANKSKLATFEKAIEGADLVLSGTVILRGAEGYVSEILEAMHTEATYFQPRLGKPASQLLSQLHLRTRKGKIAKMYLAMSDHMCAVGNRESAVAALEVVGLSAGFAMEKLVAKLDVAEKALRKWELVAELHTAEKALRKEELVAELDAAEKALKKALTKEESRTAELDVEKKALRKEELVAELDAAEKALKKALTKEESRTADLYNAIKESIIEPDLAVKRAFKRIDAMPHHDLNTAHEKVKIIKESMSEVDLAVKRAVKAIEEHIGKAKLAEEASLKVIEDKIKAGSAGIKFAITCRGITANSVAAFEVANVKAGEAYLAKAEYLCTIGDQEGAVAALKVVTESVSEKAVVPLGSQVTIALNLIRLGMLYSDTELTAKSRDLGHTLIVEGGESDRDRRRWLKEHSGAHSALGRELLKASEKFVSRASTFAGVKVATCQQLVGITASEYS
jgi:tetratricopeptide (TPR) repeat protein